MRPAWLPLLLFVVFAFTFPAFANQTVWKWVDGDGVTHYADRPVPGAIRMELNVGRSSAAESASPAAATPSYTTGASPLERRPAVTAAYRNFEIWSPQDGATIPNTGGAVTVEVRVDPSLQPGHQLHLYLDGRLVEGFAANATSFALTGLPRGTHSAIAIINDAGGKRLQETSQIEFMVRQASIAQPPVGPALRRPATPPSGPGN